MNNCMVLILLIVIFANGWVNGNNENMSSILFVAILAGTWGVGLSLGYHLRHVL